MEIYRTDDIEVINNLITAPRVGYQIANLITTRSLTFTKEFCYPLEICPEMTCFMHKRTFGQTTDDVVNQINALELYFEEVIKDFGATKVTVFGNKELWSVEGSNLVTVFGLIAVTADSVTVLRDLKFDLDSEDKVVPHYEVSTHTYTALPARPLMNYDPLTGRDKPWPSCAAQYLAINKTPWTFDPFVGHRRFVADVASDPHMGQR